MRTNTELASAKEVGATRTDQNALLGSDVGTDIATNCLSSDAQADFRRVVVSPEAASVRTFFSVYIPTHRRRHSIAIKYNPLYRNHVSDDCLMITLTWVVWQSSWMGCRYSSCQPGKLAHLCPREVGPSHPRQVETI